MKPADASRLLPIRPAIVARDDSELQETFDLLQRKPFRRRPSQCLHSWHRCKAGGASQSVSLKGPPTELNRWWVKNARIVDLLG